MNVAEIISRVPNVGHSDRTLLTAVFQKFDRVCARFDAFTQLHPMRRIPQAITDLATTPRTGWLRLDPELSFRDVLSTHQNTYNGPRALLVEPVTTGCESIAEHLLECEELYIKLFSDKPHRPLGQSVIKFHDIGESAFADFTPHDDISAEDKKRLEWIAVNLLTESRQTGNLHALHIYNCFMIFERDIDDFEPIRTMMLGEIGAQRLAGKIQSHQEGFVRMLEGIYSTPVSRLELQELQIRVKDIDLLQMAYRASRIWHSGLYGIPKAGAREKLAEFWAYVDARVKTVECRGDFERVRGHYDRE